MPPTLIASVYGMNFKMMPELEWAHGYPMALIMMLLAAVGAVLLFQMEEVVVVTEVLRRTPVLRGFHTPAENQGTRLICSAKI